MHDVSTEDLTLVLECVQELYAHPDLDALGGKILNAARKLVACDAAAYEELNPVLNRSVGAMDPIDARPGESFMQVFADYASRGGHPILAHWQATGDMKVRAISELVSRTAFRDSGIYSDLYRHFGVEDQLGMLLAVRQPVVVAIGLNRSKPFTQRERQLLDLLRPHASQAYRNAVAFREMRRDCDAALNALAAANVATVRVAAAGHILDSNVHAMQLLECYFPHWSRKSFLPDELRGWLENQATSASALAAPPAFRLERAEGRLHVRAVVQPGANTSLLIIEEERPNSSERIDPRFSKLPPRGQEVLRHLLAGASEKEVAKKMSLSRHTVHNHITSLYKRLGVTSRSELLAHCLRGSR